MSLCVHSWESPHFHPRVAADPVSSVVVDPITYPYRGFVTQLLYVSIGSGETRRGQLLIHRPSGTCSGAYSKRRFVVEWRWLMSFRTLLGVGVCSVAACQIWKSTFSAVTLKHLFLHTFILSRFHCLTLLSFPKLGPISNSLSLMRDLFLIMRVNLTCGGIFVCHGTPRSRKIGLLADEGYNYAVTSHSLL